ncbi:MAG: hypothetical protein VX589_10365 [Myxococcota bacterium]|nr:hypothetical protein [Myxococcota bacterium]
MNDSRFFVRCMLGSMLVVGCDDGSQSPENPMMDAASISVGINSVDAIVSTSASTGDSMSEVDAGMQAGGRVTDGTDIAAGAGAGDPPAAIGDLSTGGSSDGATSDNVASTAGITAGMTTDGVVGGVPASPEQPGETECISQARRRCIDGQPFWVNSCGLIEEQIQMCGDTERCELGQCVCDPARPVPPMCDGNMVVQFDGCGMDRMIVDVCVPPTNCVDGQCVRPNCVPMDELCNGVDDDCDGRVDEEAPCQNGLSCVQGRCTTPGTSCQVCVVNADCAPGFLCVLYDDFPEVGGVCTQSGCRVDADCDDNTVCDPQGICVMRISSQCIGGNPWLVDSCGRQVQQIDQCDPNRPCMDGRCFGDGETCAPCDGQGECAAGYLCIGFALNPDLPPICVPQSNCHLDPTVQCPAGLECDPLGVCAPSITPTCRADGDRWAVDSCDRDLYKIEDCPLNSLCRADRCVGGGELCAPCESRGDCADGFVCLSYSDLPNVPPACAPLTECHINPYDQCPEPLVCEFDGLCAFDDIIGCADDETVARIDTCGRTLVPLRRCPLGTTCLDGQCMPTMNEDPVGAGGTPQSGGQFVSMGGMLGVGGQSASSGGSLESGGRPTGRGGSLETGGQPTGNGGMLGIGGQSTGRGGTLGTGGQSMERGGTLGTGGQVTTAGQRGSGGLSIAGGQPGGGPSGTGGHPSVDGGPHQAGVIAPAGAPSLGGSVGRGGASSSSAGLAAGAQPVSGEARGGGGAMSQGGQTSGQPAPGGN